jgi:purine nucleoside permease
MATTTNTTIRFTHFGSSANKIPVVVNCYAASLLSYLTVAPTTAITIKITKIITQAIKL